jgi:predicted nuclease of predicted toxin-antitoxin system
VKIKVDENLPASVAVALRARGLDTHSVVDEGLGGTDDPTLLRHVTIEDRMIFTLDRGFGDIRRYPPGTHPGIVVFRLDDESAATACAAVLQLVTSHDIDDLRGTITIVQYGILRIRRSAD